MDGLKLHIAKNWRELKRNELLFVAWLYTQGLSETDFLTKAFLYLSQLSLVSDGSNVSGAKWYSHKSRKSPFLIDHTLMVELVKQVDFLLTISEIQPIKWFKLARARHFRLLNASLDEYLMAENYFFAYSYTKDPIHLNNLIAVLYRCPWQGFKRELIPKRAKRFETLSLKEKYSVYLWYSGFRSYVPLRCPSLYKGKKASGKLNIRDYINGMMHNLNLGDATKNNKLLKLNMWVALDELEQKAIDVERAKPSK